ncbi:hypothetical protein PsorP6_014637 [Peronosclerospora sorghi]|uniref:Uncharacterized protein n=1 Tax=Peronosclerospora sorghi TaxID=230839 RepID=A0ACC0VRN0_9STRA|nr:hypothetical protein PsorP6_014637 [Peronosclerospora sorghi]
MIPTAALVNVIDMSCNLEQKDLVLFEANVPQYYTNSFVKVWWAAVENSHIIRRLRETDQLNHGQNAGPRCNHHDMTHIRKLSLPSNSHDSSCGVSNSFLWSQHFYTIPHGQVTQVAAHNSVRI